jgi:hypothetical protein
MGKRNVISLPVIPLPCLVDTNVVVTANGNSEDCNPKADEDQVETCIQMLQKLMKLEALVLVLDDGGLIFAEYWGRKPTTKRRPLSIGGQPGTGDMFFKWIFDNQYNPERCERRIIHCTNEINQTFEEFPDIPELRDFDLSDRKFAAVANAGTPKRTILEFGDSKWWKWQDGLDKAGIGVVFLTDYAELKHKEKNPEKPK